MGAPRSINMGFLKRGYNIPHTEIEAYVHPQNPPDCIEYTPRLIYEDKDVISYHGRTDLQNVINTYVDNRDIGVKTGDIIAVYIYQVCPDNPYMDSIIANFWFIK